MSEPITITNTKPAAFTWQRVAPELRRMRINNGWLVCTSSGVRIDSIAAALTSDETDRDRYWNAPVFVPDGPDSLSPETMRFHSAKLHEHAEMLTRLDRRTARIENEQSMQNELMDKITAAGSEIYPPTLRERIANKLSAIIPERARGFLDALLFGADR